MDKNCCNCNCDQGRRCPRREPVEWDAWLMWGIVLLLLAVVIIAPMLEVRG